MDPTRAGTKNDCADEASSNLSDRSTHYVNSSDYIALSGKNDELVRIWIQAAVALFNTIPARLEGLKKNMKTISQDSRFQTYI
jgi:hypothetical protein